MKTNQFLLTVVLLSVFLMSTGCDPALFNAIEGSNNLKTATFAYADFERIEAAQGINVEIVQSDDFSVEVTYNDNLDDYLNVRKTGDWLDLGLESGKRYINIDITAVISMPQLREIELSSGASLNGEMVSDAGLTADISSGANAELSGEAASLILDVSSGSEFDGSALTVSTRINADISSGAEGTVSGSNGCELNADVSSGATLYYYGNLSRQTIDTSSGGSVVKK